MIRYIYDHLPEFVRKPVAYLFFYAVPFPYNRGLHYANIYRELMKTQWWSEKSLLSLQFERLRDLLFYAYENVPYYNKLFTKYGFNPKKFQDFTDLSVLPQIVLTREEINRNFEDLIPKNYDGHRVLLKTGGTTRLPMSFYVSENTYLAALACSQRQWYWAGVKPKDLIFVFRGGVVTKKAKRLNYFCERINNEVYFNTSNMDENTLNRYIDMLNRMKPAAIRGFPSCLEILSDYIIERKISVHQPKAVQTSSEVSLSKQREKIELAFGSKVFDAYGNGEHTIIATECDRHSGLHLNQEFGYTEFVKVGETEENESIYKVITTSLLNSAFVFFRYDTEDLVILDHSVCSCGRRFPLIKRIMGRCGDIIRCSNGKKISPVSFANFWVDNLKDRLKGIKYVQLVQKDLEYFVIRLIGQEDRENEQAIKEILPNLLGEKIKIDFEYLSHIDFHKKWRVTISEIE